MNLHPDAGLISPVVSERFANLLREGEYWLWSDQPDRAAIRATYRRLVLFGTEWLSGGLIVVALAVWFMSKIGANSWTAGLLAVGIIAALLGVAEAAKEMRIIRKIADSAYALTNKRLICKWADEIENIMAVQSGAVIWITRQRRGKFSDFSLTLKNDPAAPADMTMIFGVKNADQVETLLTQILIGSGVETP